MVDAQHHNGFVQRSYSAVVVDYFVGRYTADSALDITCSLAAAFRRRIIQEFHEEIQQDVRWSRGLPETAQLLHGEWIPLQSSSSGIYDSLFQMALEDIANQNMQTNATAKFGVTKYSDLSRDEFLSQKLSRNLSHFMSDNLVYNKPNYTIKADDTPIHFLDENNADRFRAFYSQGLLHKNLNFIPLKVDW